MEWEIDEIKVESVDNLYFTDKEINKRKYIGELYQENLLKFPY